MNEDMNENVHYDKLKNSLSSFLNDSISNEEYSNRLETIYNFLDYVVDTVYIKQLYGSDKIFDLIHSHIMYDIDFKVKSDIILYFLEEFFTVGTSIDMVSSNIYNMLEDVADNCKYKMIYNPSVFPVFTEFNKVDKRLLRD